VTVYDYFLHAGGAAASSLAVGLVPTPVGNATADIERAIGSFALMPNAGLLVLPDPTTVAHRDLVIALAARHHLPTVYPFRLFVAAGGLMSYGTNPIDMFGRTAFYVDKILRGAGAGTDQV
jgi:putative ABC transport system substrate-binding protein